MSRKEAPGNLFRRSPVARALLVVAVLALIFAVSSLVGGSSKRKPVITGITPTLGSPGDVVTITGSNFGVSRGTSFVELAGSRVTASGYVEWTDTQIRFVLPLNAQDGLVTVQTAAGRAAPGFFANQAGIPEIVRPDPRTTRPLITSVSPETAGIGDTLTIVGSNFGASRGSSRILFSANGENASAGNAGFIAASDMQYDYEYWTDSEIRVRVPDGATSGPLCIESAKGNSPPQELTITFPAGQKAYSGKRTYAVQLSADIQNRSAESPVRITLYIPRPPLFAMQPSVTLDEVSPEPLIRDDPFDIIQQVTLSDADSAKRRFTQHYVIDVYAVRNGIQGAAVGQYSDRTRLLYTAYTGADACVPAAAPEVVALAERVSGSARSPYEKARLLYAYVLDNFKILSSVRTGSASVLDMLERKSGDAYDFAVLFTALCRAAGIPAIPISGVLVENNSTTKNHWWAEIYFEKYGWFPVDPALGAGLSHRPLAAQSGTEERSMRDFYFGSMDSQHIAFSRGWKEMKPALMNSRTVYRPRTYALQSIWEEASDREASYSSLWNDPVIVGIY